MRRIEHALLLDQRPLCLAHTRTSNLDYPHDYDVEIMADDWMEHVGQMPETKANLWTIWPDAPTEVIEELWQRLSELQGIGGFLQKLPPQNTSNAMDLSNLKPGYRPIPGKPYELTEELGQGGFGAVWKGKNEKLGRFFVFKFCNEPLNPTKLKSLHNELRLVSKLNHPEIVRLHEEYLELESPHLPCLIYDFVDGVDLHTVLAERKKQERSLSVEEATGLILKIAEIIAYVHSHPEKIVHRDLKPANILVTNPHDLALLSAIGGHADLRLAQLKVMDFGIGGRSSHGRDSASRMNSYGIAFDGFRSEGYASPQQERGEPATECDDVYALGAMWQQFLLGRVPKGTGWIRTLQTKQMTEKQIQVVEGCLEDDCGHRIKNAKELVERIVATLPQAVLTDSYEESVRKASLAVEEDEEIPVKHLTVGGAAALAANWQHEKLSLPKLKSLSIEAAGKLATWKGEWLYLNGLTSLSPETAEKLATWKGTRLELNGLTSLSPETAGELAKWECLRLELNGLTSLSPETAEKLAMWKGGWIELNGLTSISPETAGELATWKGARLELNGLTSLSPETAEKLATRKGTRLELNGLTSLRPETAEKLAMWKGYWLALYGLTSLSPETAERLAMWKGDKLQLNGLTSLSPETAEKLAAWKGTRLELNGLTSLSPETAERLAMWKGAGAFDDEDVSELDLNGLTTLSPETAEKLATWEGWYLHLNGLTSLSPETAERLAMWKGAGAYDDEYVSQLGLNGLTTLSPETAEKLATCNGTCLELNGLTSLSPETAEKLATCNGTCLELNGLTSLSPETAEKLATWKGTCLELNGLTSLSPETAERLAMWKGAGAYDDEDVSQLGLNGLTTLSPETAERLATWKGDWLALKGLTSLSPETAEKLATWKGKWLYLNGLTSLSLETAGKLAAWTGKSLLLKGLTSLSSQTAGKLATWKGTRLELKGLTSLSRQTAEAVFWKAAEAGGWALAKQLLSEVLKVDFAKVSGNKVLFMAVKADREDAIEFFAGQYQIIGYRPDLSITLAETGDTLLHLAAKLGHHKVVAALLEAGAKPQGKNKEGKTVLQCAVDSGSMETVRLLVPKDT